MDRNNLKLKTISLNVRGIRTFEKRKSIFNWLIKQNSDICFLQETYSTEETENLWKSQWPGEIYFAHGIRSLFSQTHKGKLRASFISV